MIRPMRTDDMKAEAEVGMASYFYFFMAHLSLRSLGEFDRCDAEYSRNGMLILKK